MNGRFDTVLVGLGCGVCSLMAASAHGAWSVGPTVEVESGYDDNVRMLSDEAEEEDGIVTRATAQVRVRNVSEVTELTGIAGISYLSYAQVDTLDDEDIQYATLKGEREMERGRIGGRASLRRDVLLRRLEPIPGLVGSSGEEPLPEDDRGIVTEDPGSDQGLADDDIDVTSSLEQVRRTRVQLSPYLQYQLTELRNARLTYVYSERLFDEEGEQEGLRDSTVHSGVLALTQGFTPRTAARLSMSVSRYEAETEPDEQDAESDNYVVALGLDRQLTPQAGIGIDIGAGRTETDSRSDTNLTYAIRAFRETEVGRLSATAERSTRPSAFGNTVDAERLSVRYQRALSTRLEMGFDAYGYRTERIIDEVDQEEVSYFEASPRVTWRVTQAWNLGLAYRFRWTDREGDRFEQGQAESNAVTISLSYQRPTRF